MNPVCYVLADTSQELQETHEARLPLQSHPASATTHPLGSSPANLPTWHPEIHSEFFTGNIGRTAAPNMGFKGVQKMESPAFSGSRSIPTSWSTQEKPKVAQGKKELNCSLHMPSRNKEQLCCADPRPQH